MQLVLSGLACESEEYSGGGEEAPSEWRLSVQLGALSLVDELARCEADSGQPGRESGRAAPLLFFAADDASLRPKEHPCLLVVSLSQCDGGIRLFLRLQPVRLRVSQLSLAFLLDFATTTTAAAAAAAATARGDAGRGVGGGGAGGVGVFVELCDVRPLYLRVDYLVTLASFSSLYAFGATPSSRQLLHLIPVSDVRITLGRLRLRGLTSWAALEAAVAEEWQPQLLAQLHRYVAGVTPLRSMVNVARGLRELLLAPLRPSPIRGLRHGGDALARSLLEEGLGLTSRVLSFLQLLLEQLDVAVGEASVVHAPLRRAIEQAALVTGSPSEGTRLAAPNQQCSMQ